MFANSIWTAATLLLEYTFLKGLRWLRVKNLPINAGDAGLICEKSPGGGNGNPLQYSYL